MPRPWGHLPGSASAMTCPSCSRQHPDRCVCGSCSLSYSFVGSVQWGFVLCKPFDKHWLQRLKDSNILPLLPGHVQHIYCLQVLSVQTALSIQSHPDKELAEKLHSERPKASLCLSTSSTSDIRQNLGISGHLLAPHCSAALSCSLRQPRTKGSSSSAVPSGIG